MAMVRGDFIRRSLLWLEYDVTYVRNYTDVGHLDGDNAGDADLGTDRMEKGSKKEGLTPLQVADKYIQQFDEDIAALNVLPADARPRATDYVQQMIKLVEVLLEKGFAYSTPKAIYFEVSKAKDYTKLSGRKLDELETGAGHATVDDTENKRHPADFALWFFKTGAHQNASQTWPSPFESAEVDNGEGFPGWHIECSAMVIDLLGETIDLHMGGVEHISIHHPNEIAQSEAATGKKYVNYWLHNEHLSVDNKKMAKSEGTGYILTELTERGFHPMDLRYFFTQAHYRSKQNFTWEALEGAQTALKRLNQELWKSLGKTKKTSTGVDEEYIQKFREALEDDFNIPKALSFIWEMLKDPKPATYATIKEFDKVLGLRLGDVYWPETPDEISDARNEEVKELLSARKLAREAGDYSKADEIRDKLKKEYGFEVQDTEEGQTVTQIH
jgi:cysteinyl-tRNA synthetase